MWLQVDSSLPLISRNSLAQVVSPLVCPSCLVGRSRALKVRRLGILLPTPASQASLVMAIWALLIARRALMASLSPRFHNLDMASRMRQVSRLQARFLQCHQCRRRILLLCRAIRRLADRAGRILSRRGLGLLARNKCLFQAPAMGTWDSRF